MYFCRPYAGVMELVDMLDLGSSASRRGSSSLPARTIKASLIPKLRERGFFYERN